MKNYIFPLALLLLFAAGCSRMTGEQPQAAFVPDSLWTPTGNAELDSLLQLAAVAPQDTNLVKLYYNIGRLYDTMDFELAKTYYMKTGSLSDQLDWNKGRISYAGGYAFILEQEGLADSALVLYKYAHELAKLDNEEWMIASMSINIGTTYASKGWYETSLEYFMEALSFFDKRNDDDIFNLQVLYMSMSQLYGEIHDVEKAIEYGEKAVALNREYEFAVYSLGMAYLMDNQYDKANEYLEETLRICELQNNLYLMGIVYVELSNCALAVFDLEKAEKYARQSLEINRQSGPVTFGGSYIALSMVEKLKGNYTQSEAHAREALQIAAEFELTSLKKDAYTILSELAVAQRKYRENVQYRNEIALIEKIIAKETILHASEEMSAKYETEKKELEIGRQQQVISRHKLQRWVLVTGILVCMLILALLWFMLRLRNRRNLALAEMNATKDKFFSIISHDLKNPALAQRDALQLLIKNAHEWDIDTLTGYYHELLKSAEGQVELLYNLLNWAQVQTGRMAYTPMAFNLSTHLRADLSLIRKMAENKGITLAVSMPEDVLVTGDSNMLVTVVRNLLTNAVKFTGEGGQITLDLSQSTDALTTVTVSDTGTGMHEDQIRNLFQLNSRYSQRGTADEQGSGLGLIVCKELLDKHGSALHVESKEGKGSRFWFSV